MFMMELSEKERLMLVEKKEQIQKLTSEILDTFEKITNLDQMVEIKKKINHIISILSIIGSYAKPKMNLEYYESAANLIFYKLYLLERICQLNPNSDWKDAIRTNIEEFCTHANAIQFEFTKSGIKIHIPKIEFSFLKQEKF